MEATFDAQAIEFGTVNGTVAAGTNTMQLGTVNGTVTAATNTMQQTSAFAAPYGTTRRPVVTGRHARPGKVTVLAIGRAVPEMMIKNEGLADNFLRDANVDDPIMLAKHPLPPSQSSFLIISFHVRIFALWQLKENPLLIVERVFFKCL
jgi:hypothetical protein